MTRNWGISILTICIYHALSSCIIHFVIIRSTFYDMNHYFGAIILFIISLGVAKFIMSYRLSPEFAGIPGNLDIVDVSTTRLWPNMEPEKLEKMEAPYRPGNQHHADAASALLTGAHRRHEPICIPQRARRGPGCGRHLVRGWVPGLQQKKQNRTELN